MRHEYRIACLQIPFLPYTGTPSSVTVSKDTADRYHILILVEENSAALPFSQQKAGIDLGLVHAVNTSNGQKVNNHQYLKQSEKNGVGRD